MTRARDRSGAAALPLSRSSSRVDSQPATPVQPFQAETEADREGRSTDRREELIIGLETD